MRKLLITGASGFLGWNLLRVASEGWDVRGVVHKNPSRDHDFELYRADLTRFDEIRDVFGKSRPDAVIHAAAASNPNFCQLNPEYSHRINVEATINIASICADISIPFVFISTDLVFDGLTAPYSEGDPVSPVSLYGEQKAEAEAAVLKRHPRALVCRMAIMFGDSGPGAVSFIQPWIEDMKNGREIHLFKDEYRTPVSGTDAALGILLGLSRATGILHIGGLERVSRLEFGKLLQNVIGIRDARISECSQKDLKMPAPRPPDVSLNIARAVGLGFRPGLLRNELEKLACVR